jgi:hypothetical protein
LLRSEIGHSLENPVGPRIVQDSPHGIDDGYLRQIPGRSSGSLAGRDRQDALTVNGDEVGPSSSRTFRSQNKIIYSSIEQ